MTTEEYQKLLPKLPDQPGVYKFMDDENHMLYVGKAKNLKKRVASYFGNKKHMAYKTRTLVKNAHHLDYVIVDTEHDALLLENTLIKKYQPRYNVNLKDGKSYTYLCVKNERFPRVFFTRLPVKDGSTYFGPYTSKYRARMVLELIKTLFPVRTCNYFLSEENIQKGKFKICLEYHINNCYGPCEGLEEEEIYNERIGQIKNLLKGHFRDVKRHFKKQMRRYSENLEFEKAQQLKVKLEAFDDYQSKSTVVGTAVKDVDVFSITKDEKLAYVNYIKVVNGAIINTFTQELTPNLDTDERELLEYAIDAIREKTASVAPEIIVPFEVEIAEKEVAVIIPARGDKRRLLELSEKNVKYFLLMKKKEEMQKRRKKTAAERILSTMKEDLQMEEVPIHIECFDNSNMQGSNPVASCVVFKNAKPSKKDYRKFNIKTVSGPDDFASMEEVVFRRYRRLTDEGQDLPQLIVIDGGKGQLSSAVKSLKKLGIFEKVTIIGVAKKLEEIFFPGDPLPLYINKKSESLKLIQQIRNEAHRFAISFHRDKRSKELTQTELTQIPGVGEKTAEKLLQQFGSVKKLKDASRIEIARITGRVTSVKIMEYLGRGEEEE